MTAHLDQIDTVEVVSRLPGVVIVSIAAPLKQILHLNIL